MSGKISDVTDKNFEKEVLQAELPVLVDFWAAWCAPCRMMTPILEDLEKALSGQIKIVKLNVDENRKIAAKFGIMSIPTLLIFKQGDLKETMVGVSPLKQIKQAVEKHL